MKKDKISIIIPILNEADTIKDLLYHLIDNASLENISEIIVVDGGSTDGSQSIIKSLDLSITLLTSPKGRAKQMNVGAKAAKSKILYFLHADSYPPHRYDEFIINEVKNNNLAGCFKMKFDHSHWWLRLASWLTKFSWRACRGGDQSQFITKTLFETLGCFNEKFTIYEDNDLINKLYAINEFVVIQQWLTTSARRYKDNGIWKLQYHFWTIYVKKWFGASAEELHKYYLKHIT
ncbi:TIGR04283 family arsenosugar biosynthesis glycosyltransferase [uncultured Lacinutrix sp.]|uniref:TIGR04283 family arsenosugar biosynthesis glycosyltransferase n=1 Tax=uncultured Lacinutrix sp. TaxID=574032 RepID=UPI0026393DAA|nr:TIGR04283 family arsenosugar biosynthesis glycosyltransferase [uncultured Lacinutrix sp.]